MSSLSNVLPRISKTAQIIWAIAAALALSQVGTAIADDYQFFLNETDSLPNWAFWVDKNHTEPRRGDYFAFVPPANPYYPPSFRFAKQVVGVPGDHVTIRGRDFYINGQFAGTAKTHDQQGTPVQMSAPGTIPAGRYFVVTPHKDSFDSRYAIIGLIDRKMLVGKAYPVL
ncbi:MULTISPECIES: signal peptidase I [Asticcacaulis]|jgi:conjugal transfer pilin signal peptidase TrbI|uniref:signal peptidase I n=1 Tax=Asticcacaulis TaxID=76890 RepID=UPI001AE7358E|nr:MULTISPECIES: signal peptidase I [Asticcacaulis]MBP2160573.1 conjugal transfer pilin signal peptidase TrbI [Asticcacaulis solisilvae]MDR6801618.1 conjugal transfer pilin signal peptidase TrbI [Asticcacaulis sp. BE141]